MTPDQRTDEAGDPAGDFVLVLSCPDRPGIVHAVTSFLVSTTATSGRASSTATGGWAGSSCASTSRWPEQVGAEALRADFAATAEQFDMTFELWSAHAPYRTLIMVSKQQHCLNDLLFRQSTGSLQIEVAAVVSNHLDAEPLVKSYGLAFHHLPVTPDTKAEAEARLMRPGRGRWTSTWSCWPATCRCSPTTCAARLDGRVINIHHSFLPSFKGARPYHQAFDRGVKLVGATAHYVTADLDEGPIIEQDVCGSTTTYSAEQLVPPAATSRRRCSPARSAGTPQSRVLLNGDRTVVFH